MFCYNSIISKTKLSKGIVTSIVTNTRWVDDKYVFEKHEYSFIHKENWGYRFSKKGCKRKSFKTLEEAISYRDNILKNKENE